MKNESGFSLIEILVVVAVLGIVTALAVPNLKRARQSANAASAVASARTISTAERLYSLKNSAYGTLVQLVPEGTLDTNLQSGLKSNYLFSISVSADLLHYGCNADPDESSGTLPHYFVDDTNVITIKAGAPADSSSAPIQ
jgi:prepilin-type N-terminal cleavage/methylation domain-containing protein